MTALGIDIGSRYIKAVLLERGEWVKSGKAETSFDPLGKCREILRDMPADRVVATGYGRHLLEIHADTRAITEIKAFARGARAVFPNCRTIIDIGGQDTKVIALNEQGKVWKFEMNDRCAAGTGKFLEIMAKSLGFSLEEFGPRALTAHRGDPAKQHVHRLCGIGGDFLKRERRCPGGNRHGHPPGDHQAGLRRWLNGSPSRMK